MKPHTAIYYKAFQYDISEYIQCEMCLNRAVDICHIEPRGMGGSKQLDRIENLMAMCRDCHIKTEGQKSMKSTLFTRHRTRMIVNLVRFDELWINEQIRKHGN
jgi:hypothetical protein